MGCTNVEVPAVGNESAADTLQAVQTLVDESRDQRDQLRAYTLVDLVRAFTAEWHLYYANDSERATSFLQAVTQLMEWKAMLLLPVAPREIAEEETWQPELLLGDLAAFQQIAMMLGQRQEEQAQMVRRQPLPPGALQAEPVDPVLGLQLADLQHAFQRIAKRILEQVEEVHIGTEHVSRQECQFWLVEYMQSHASVPFDQLFLACPPRRAYWVVVFLLLLEMVFNRIVGVHIGDTNEDILLVWMGVAP